MTKTSPTNVIILTRAASFLCERGLWRDKAVIPVSVLVVSAQEQPPLSLSDCVSVKARRQCHWPAAQWLVCPRRLLHPTKCFCYHIWTRPLLVICYSGLPYKAKNQHHAGFKWPSHTCGEVRGTEAELIYPTRCCYLNTTRKSQIIQTFDTKEI